MGAKRSGWWVRRSLGVVLVAVALAAFVPGVAAAAESGTISGTVRNTDGDGIPAQVLYYRDTGEGVSLTGIQTTASDGTYSKVMAAGTYILLFRDRLNPATYMDSFYDGRTGWDTADRIELVDGGSLTADATLTAYCRIEGRVTGGGVDLSGITVSVHRRNVYGYWDLAAAPASTDATGTYSVKMLNPGTYRVRFRDPAGDYAQEFYSGALSIADGDDVVLTAEDVATIDADLEEAARITGTVTNLGTPLSGIEVSAYRYSTSTAGWESMGDPVVTGAGGTYDLGGLSEGGYRVHFRDPRYVYLEQWYDGVEWDSATRIDLAVAQTRTGIDAALKRLGSLTGTVRSMATSAPIAGVTCEVYRWDEAWRSWSWMASRSTGGAGEYLFDGLTPGVYRVRFSGGTGGYASQYYDSAHAWSQATSIACDYDTVTSGIDAALYDGATISGTVTGAGPIDGAEVVAWREDGSGGWDHWYTYTESNGAYTLRELPPGDYYVTFNGGSGYICEVYDGVHVGRAEIYLGTDAAPDFTGATSVSLTEGGAAAGVSAELEAGGHVTGRVTYDTGGNAYYPQVRALVPDGSGGWRVYAEASSDENGCYDIGQLATGEYVIRFDDYYGPMPYTYYGDVDSPGAATLVAVTAGGTVPDIDGVLRNPVDDGYEPDNTPWSAKHHEVGETAAHTFSYDTDQDYAWFQGYAGHRYRVETVRTWGTVDTSLTVFGADGTTVLGVNDDGPAPPFSAVEFTAPVSDTYRVLARFTGERGLYGLRITDISDVAPPVTTILGMPSGPTSQTVAFSLSATDGPDGSGVDRTLYTLDADGPFDYVDPVEITAEGTTTVGYWSVDNRGNEESRNTTTVVIDRAPPETTDDHLASYVGSATVQLTPFDAGSGTASTVWRVNGGALTVGTVVTSSFVGTNTLEYRSFDVAGNAEATVTVTFRITRANSAPVAAADSFPVAKNTTLTVTATGVLANDTDPDGDPLTAVLASDVTFGTLTLDPAGSFTYRPPAGFSGTVTFTYRASDGTEDSGPATVTIDVQNSAPDAVADSYSVAKNTTLTVAAPGVLSNDTDPDGDGLTVTELSTPSTGTLSATSTAGAFTYVPPAGYSGAVTFTYRASDGVTLSAQATVTITVKPPASAVTLAGDDRYDTALAVSRAGYASGECTAVILATGANFPDALSAGALAGVRDCPILLVNGQGTTLPTSVRDEIRRLTQGRSSFDVYLMGGTAAISAAVENSAKAQLTGERVIRVAGTTRYDTAIDCARKVRAAAGRPLVAAFLTTGVTYGDALLAGPVAFAHIRPVLITNNTGAVNGKIAAALTAIGAADVAVIGSGASVTTATVNAMAVGRTCARVAGAADVYGQSVDVANWAAGAGLLSWSAVGVATGEKFADALGASPFLGAARNPLLLTRTKTLPAPVRDAVAANKSAIGRVTYFGGLAAVEPAVRNAVTDALK